METHLHTAVEKKVDGLLWVPYWGLGRKGLALTKNAGIPVIFVDSYQGGLQPQSEEFPNYHAFIGPADETGAYEMGKYLLSNMPSNKNGQKFIAALDGPVGAPTAIIRHKGLLRAIKEYPETVLVTSKNADYQSDLAELAFKDMLNEYPQIQGVWAANDSMIHGAIQAAKNQGKIPGKDLFFVGMDLDSQSIELVRKGEQLFDIGGHWLQIGFGLGILFDSLNGYGIPKGRSIIKLPLLYLTQDKVSQFEKDYPNGLPPYDFKQKSRTYYPDSPLSFFEMKYSED
ncbi:MAG: substrate-binding domain-containing protein [Anaerolineaceae bacterium]